MPILRMDDTFRPIKDQISLLVKWRKTVLKINSWKSKSAIFAATVALAVGSSNFANADTFNSVSHIHQVKVFKNQILLLTHQGLFTLVGKNNMRQISKEKIDIMGMAVVGAALYAGGHPAEGSQMPNPIGLIKSIDGGVTWKAISLVGKVDFHIFEGSTSDLFGSDSQSGDLLHSSDLGKTWSNLGANAFDDIAVSPEKSGVAIALKGNELFHTDNAFKSTIKIKSSQKFSQIEWVKSGLYGLSGSTLYKSIDSAKTWKKLRVFEGNAGVLSADDQLLLVTVGANIYTSESAGVTFKKVI